MANITRRGEEGIGGIARDPIGMMRELLRWDPFAQMAPSLMTTGETFVPKFEVKERKDAYVFKADLPGVKEDDLDVSLTGNRLTISGKRESEKKEEEDRFFAWECSYGSFSRSFTLPEGVDAEHVNADLKNGVLTLTLPKKPEIQPKKIEVKGSAEGKTFDKGKAHA